jgi:signal transduction histidine kinase
MKRTAAVLKRYAFDAAVVAVAVFTQIEIWAVPVPGPKIALVPGMLFATLPLLARRRFPFAAPACVFAALAGMTFADSESTSGTPSTIFALLFAFWVMGAQRERRPALAGLVTGLAAIVVIIERDPGLGYAGTSGHFLFAGGVWLAALVLQRRSHRAAELEEEAARLERERGERERAAVADERRRIARDLHEVIAHSVGVMTVQAGAARLLLAEEAEGAREPLVSVEETGRQALAEMRRLLGILRREDDEAALAPQPGLARLEGLVAEASSAGLPVELTVEGERATLPRGVDLAAYRIVQEALANARKHAGPARARVTVRYGDETLELEIASDGQAAASADGDGHGLVGMRERAELYGGELEAGPSQGGGYAVRARLPVEPARAPRHHREEPRRSREDRTRASGPTAFGSLAAVRWFDALVVLLAVVSELEILIGSVPGPKLVTIPGALLYTLPLLLRRRFPFAAPALTFAAQAAVAFAGEEAGSAATGFVSLLLAFWVAGAAPALSHAVAGLAVGIASVVVIGERDVGVELAQAGNAVFVFVAVWFAALVLQRHSRRAGHLERRAARLERERAEREVAAVADERRRIARDLHDVVAHSVSVMTVQAGAARLLLAEEPERARAPLLSIEETGRQALGEMRRLLGFMRADEAEAALAPQPGLARLGDLVAQARTAGLPVEVTLEGESEALPRGVDLAAYRIVQEALTNARKHAVPARTHVAVRYAEGTLDLEIVNEGKPLPRRNDTGGHGLVGMRERVALYGGELAAGPRADGGYTVHARLPVEPQPT